MIVCPLSPLPAQAWHVLPLKWAACTANRSFTYQWVTRLRCVLVVVLNAQLEKMTSYDAM